MGELHFSLIPPAAAVLVTSEWRVALNLVCWSGLNATSALYVDLKKQRIRTFMQYKHILFNTVNLARFLFRASHGTNECTFSIIFSPPLLQTAGAPSLLPGRTNAIFICSSSHLQKLCAGSSGDFSPLAAASVAEHNAIPTKRPLRQPHNVEHGRRFLHLESVALD